MSESTVAIVVSELKKNVGSVICPSLNPNTLSPRELMLRLLLFDTFPFSGAGLADKINSSRLC